MTGAVKRNKSTIRYGHRGIAIATVCVTVAATATANGAFLLTIPLILGLIAQASGARRGQWLMWLGAGYLSVTVLFMEIAIFPELLAELRSHHRLGGLGPVLLPLCIASVLLIIWCDALFVTDAVRVSRSGTRPQRRQIGIGDWIVWITALLFTAYSFWGIRFFVGAYAHGLASSDIFLTTLSPTVIAVFFDVALIIDAVKDGELPDGIKN